MLDTRTTTSDSDKVNVIPLVEAVFQWCEFSRGNKVAEETLATVAQGLGADAAALSRVKWRGTVNANVLTYDPLSQRSNLPRLDRSYAARLLSDYISSVRPGTIWLRSLIETEQDADLDKFHCRREFAEFAVIPLSAGSGSADFLELHFRKRLSPEQNGILNTIGGTLASSWAARAPGLFVEAVLDRKRNGSQNKVLDQSILGLENAYKLSRMEFRVCVCLSRGLSREGVISELEISPSTLRTHLRNIYAKTAVENMAQLVFLLLDQPKNTPLPSRRMA
ncbi:helix-turn-helix transcriptional regulator [Marimonas sp. MJW-29]|uniref:Helix-turn-helix transcriptional regulator n=1 Tax=Sulfitobacter sediminis TaxID=3234186 RepID=A0ABV3RV65_9RHOB